MKDKERNSMCYIIHTTFYTKLYYLWETNWVRWTDTKCAAPDLINAADQFGTCSADWDPWASRRYNLVVGGVIETLSRKSSDPITNKFWRGTGLTHRTGTWDTSKVFLLCLVGSCKYSLSHYIVQWWATVQWDHNLTIVSLPARLPCISTTFGFSNHSII